ncbi:homeobox-leucine zipper protein hox32 [Phtheirospermum japonicum]|uniref:Homeobox-leucine zipper protein hox32 n=1 Tax=Phtheirospermum japonicum TaxID=374723 RepID=A0A830CMN9_9LAMI|nr:homeobox-leucine zipper protein hox32 [Phtheirospermum japonicum]
MSSQQQHHQNLTPQHPQKDANSPAVFSRYLRRPWQSYLVRLLELLSTCPYDWYEVHLALFEEIILELLEIAALASNGGFSTHSSQLQSCGDSSEDELSVLPRHTKVVVTGNNRTKPVLVGLQGVVKKFVGLGGWHWLLADL